MRRPLPGGWRRTAGYGKSDAMFGKGLILVLLASAALPALAGDLILSASDTSIPKDFTCGDAKKQLAGKYSLDVVFEPSPAPHSILKVSKAGKVLCTIEGSGTTQHDKMVTSKTRLFISVDTDRKAIDIVVITPTDMRDKVRNQVFYLPLSEAN